MKATHYRIPLRVVFYQEGSSWVAHCLEFDLMGDGETREEALQSLNHAIATQLEWAVEKKDIGLLFHAAPEQFQEMFAAGDDVANDDLRAALLVPNVTTIKFDGAIFRVCSHPSLRGSLCTFA